MKALVFGSRGWICSQFVKYLHAREIDVKHTDVRADDVERVEALLEKTRPDRVVCFIGRTHGEGINTIDYLEKAGKLKENIRDNLFAPIALALACSRRGIHLTYLGTGCIFTDPDPTAFAHDEDALPNFYGSSYSTVKGFTDRLMHMFPKSVLNVRIRMPITDERHPRNFITKIASYPKICSIPNSMTVLPSLLPLLADMIYKKEVGTINLTNPGTISHNEILEMYRDAVDPGHTWANMSLDEQDKMLASKRSNNQLDTSRLEDLYPDVPNIRDAVLLCMLQLRDTKLS